MEKSENSRLGPFQKIELLRSKIALSSDQNPFYIHLENPQLINFDFIGGVIPQKVKVINLVKRSPTRKSPDHIVVQIGPWQGHNQVTYACFPINIVQVKDDKVFIDCARVYKEGIFTSLPNFFTDKTQN